MDEQFMRKKAVLPLITSMALPMVLSMLVNALYNIVDSYFVARISENAMTALSLVYPLQNLVNAIAIGFGVGISAVIALYLGAGKQKRADQAATQGMLWALVHGVLLTGVCIAIIPLFLQAFTKDQAVIDLGVRYGRIVFGFSIIINADLAFEKIFQAVGRMKVTMVGLGLGCLANIILDPLLIFGLGPFPKMGIDGAALATGLGQVLTLVIYLLFYYLRPISVKIRLQHLRPSRHLVGRLYAIGIPAAIMQGLLSVMVLFVNLVFGTQGDMAEPLQAAYGIYYKIQQFALFAAFGLSNTLITVVAFHYGRQEKARLRQCVRYGLLYAAGLMLLVTLLFQIFASPIAGLFQSGDSPEIHQLCMRSMRICTLGYVFMGVTVLIQGILQGFRCVFSPLVLALLRLLVLPIPFCLLFLAGSHGTEQVWWAFPLAECITAVISVPILLRTFRKKTQPANKTSFAA